MYFFKEGALNNTFSHLWSLGVEEQFYMVWPFILIFVSKRFYAATFSALIIASLVLNTIFQPTVDAFRVLTIANLHTLGIGALLAWMLFFNSNSKWYQLLSNYRFSLWLISIALLIYFLNFKIFGARLNVFLVEFFLMTTTGLTVLNSIAEWPGFLNFIFKNTVLHHIGKISYGVYLYHLLIPTVLMLLIDKIPAFGFLMPENVLIQFMVLSTYSYLIAVGSFYLYENRFLKQKKKFVD
jgi:peptidoglycan/LPS O-acetylase OafA/YrhL